MSPYIFVAAVLLAIIPILVIFKISIEKIKENPEQHTKAQIHFFIGAALSEVIPIILIIYGFVNLTAVNDIQELYMPGIIIFLTIGIACFFILLQKTVDVEDHVKDIVNQFVILSIGITNAIPIIAIVSLISMIP